MKCMNLIVGGNWDASELTCDRDKEIFKAHSFSDKEY